MTSRDVWDRFDAGQQTFTRDEMDVVLIALGHTEMECDEMAREVARIGQELERERDLVDILRRSLSMRLVPHEVG